jgi:7-cyano-7-deazaguanine tRNA-ribosyltransferase
MEDWKRHFDIEGCIVNAYFLYKNREIRSLFAEGQELHRYLNFDGIIMTDSGAFQGLTRQLFLENKTIVMFQDQIGADVVSPLDLITPPGDRRVIAEQKMNATHSRVREAKSIVRRSTLAGVQQGGRFLDLRRRSAEALVAIGVQYIAIGSLVPFFNRKKNLEFIGNVLRDARAIAGPEIPIHVYGAGDPAELPFFVALGADIFDSSSYGHYAVGGWYMTSFGAINQPDRIAAGEYRCGCHVCSVATSPGAVFSDKSALAAHNLWTILETIRRVRRALSENGLSLLLSEILAQHMEWFPKSELGKSWESLHG